MDVDRSSEPHRYRLTTRDEVAIVMMSVEGFSMLDRSQRRALRRSPDLRSQREGLLDRLLSSLAPAESSPEGPESIHVLTAPEAKLCLAALHWSIKHDQAYAETNPVYAQMLDTLSADSDLAA